MLECPLYHFIRDLFPSLFQKVVQDNFKYFFQLDHQVDIGLGLMEVIALCYSRELFLALF